MQTHSDLWLVIINPASAGGRGKKRWPRLKRSLEERNILFHFVISENEDDIRTILKVEYEKGIRNFSILGGDGSFHILVNAVMHHGWPLQDIRLALFPAGTGNDWRKTHEIRNDPDHVAELIARGSFVSHDVASIRSAENSWWYVNLLGAGLDAAAVDVYHKRMSGLPIGKIKYILALLVALLGYRRQDVTIHCDDRDIYSGKFLNLNLAIGGYSGGGMHTVPHARFNDGRLEGVLVPRISFFKILLNLPGLFNGKYVELEEVQTFSGRMVQMKFSQPNRIDADGEIMENSREFIVEIIPQALKVASAVVL